MIQRNIYNAPPPALVRWLADIHGSQAHMGDLRARLWRAKDGWAWIVVNAPGVIVADGHAGSEDTAKTAASNALSDSHSGS